MIEIDKLYLHELDKWCKYAGDQQAYFAIFIEKLANQLQINISSDQRIIPPIHKLIKTYEYLEFSSKKQHRSPLKIRLKKIITLLAEYQFISIRNCQELINKLDRFYLLDRFKSFINSVESTQKSHSCILDAPQIERIWRSNIQKNFEQIWSFLANKKIYDQIIVKLYQICQPCIKKYSIQKINEIKQYSQQNIKYLKQTKQIASTIYDLFSPPINPKLNQQYNDSINSFITDRSLFLNEQKMQLAFQQIRQIIATLKMQATFSETLTYDIYGSIRTGFALISESDGDININPTNQYQMSRSQKIKYLSEIYQLLKNNLKKLNLYNIQVFTFDKIKVPFVKLKFYSKSVLKHVDLIVSSPNGIQNSKILQMYSKSQYIIKFANLIKLWAKKKTLINVKMPVQGFSSYGIVLMAIFYLIKTDQAPLVIQTVNGYRLQKNLLKQKDCKSLLENFIGFLEFYKCNGPFFSEKMIVCLMQIPNLGVQDKYLVNMYDFVDKSNPGRMPKIYIDKFFTALNQTYKMLLNQCEISQIMRLQG